MKMPLTTDNTKLFQCLSRVADTLEWISTLLISDEDTDWVLQTVYEAADEVTDLIRLVQSPATK